MWLNLITLLFQMFMAGCIASCSSSDWKTLIGNPGFDVQSTQSAVNSQGDVLVAGIIEAQYMDFTSAFIYLLKYEDCTVSWQYHVNAITDSVYGITWSYDESYAYIIGADGQDEYFVVVQDPYMLRPSTENGVGDLSVWNFGAWIEDSHSLLPHPYLNYKVLAIGAGGMAQIQAYPAKSTYLIR